MKPAAILLAHTVLLAGCMSLPEASPLAGTRWQLAMIEAEGRTTRLDPAQARRHSLGFLEGGALILQLDCNRGRAHWSLDAGAGGAAILSMGPVASTRMACPGPNFAADLAALGGSQARITTQEAGRLVLEIPGRRFTFLAAD
jgi:heat shock protein HslJ